MKVPNNLYFLIDKYLAGHANEEEKKLLHDWYRNQDHSVVDWPVDSYSAEEDVYQRMFSKIEIRLADHKKQSKSRVIKWYKMIAAAAVILIVASIGILYINPNKNIAPDKLSAFKNDISPASGRAILKLANGNEILLDDTKVGTLAEQEGVRIVKSKDGQLIYDLSGATTYVKTSGFNTIITPPGGQYQIVLPDGTRAWLNAVSSVRFPIRFNGAERVVETSGEVYFEVAKLMIKDIRKLGKENRMPFIVKSSRQQVEVLGTHFNINAYGDNGTIITTLLEGSIKIKAIGSSTEKILKPGQQAQVDKDATVNVSVIDTEEIIAWKNNQFLFNNMPIEQVMLELKRWYDIDIVYSDVKPNLMFTGVVPKNNPISILLKVLESSGGVKFTIEGKRVIVKKSPIKTTEI